MAKQENKTRIEVDWEGESASAGPRLLIEDMEKLSRADRRISGGGD
jgi:hypothetical protein